MWLSKRFAPNHPPSSMICDGLSSYIVGMFLLELLPRGLLTNLGSQLQGLGERDEA